SHNKVQQITPKKEGIRGLNMLTNLRFIQSKFWLLNNYLIENIWFLLISSVMVTLAHHKIWCNWRSSCNNFVIVIML
ncbi:hypothetical protein DND01_25115, partial [Escherichia albertii]|nr:hypothetical protein [Escherichia albertii]